MINSKASSSDENFVLTEDQHNLIVQFVDLGNKIVRSVKLHERKSFCKDPELINDMKVDLARMGQIANRVDPDVKEFESEIPWILFEIIDVVEIMEQDALLDLVDSLPSWMAKLENSILANFQFLA